jgi:hypothetical protein
VKLLATSAAVLAIALLSSCSKGADKKELTRDVFAAAVSKCQPLDAKYVTNTDGPPTIEITVPNGQSAVPDCMAREFDGYGLRAIQITIDRGRSV